MASGAWQLHRRDLRVWGGKGLVYEDSTDINHPHLPIEDVGSPIESTSTAWTPWGRDPCDTPKPKHVSPRERNRKDSSRQTCRMCPSVDPANRRSCVSCTILDDAVSVRRRSGWSLRNPSCGFRSARCRRTVCPTRMGRWTWLDHCDQLFCQA